MKPLKLLLPLVVLLSFILANAEDVRTGEDVLRVMHDRYAKTWYETLTSRRRAQPITPTAPAKLRSGMRRWQRPGGCASILGLQAITTDYPMVDGTLTILKGGNQAGTRPLINMLLVLGFDVYRQAPAATIKIAKDEGYDLTKFHEEIWEERQVYVVGGKKAI